MNKASGLLIPAGRIQHFQPTLPASAKSLDDERDRKSGLNPTDETLNDLNKHIHKLVVDDKRNGNTPSTNATIEQAYRIYAGLLRAIAANNRTTRPTRASGSPTRPTKTPR